MGGFALQVACLRLVVFMQSLKIGQTESQGCRSPRGVPFLGHEGLWFIIHQPEACNLKGKATHPAWNLI